MILRLFSVEKTSPDRYICIYSCMLKRMSHVKMGCKCQKKITICYNFTFVFDLFKMASYYYYYKNHSKCCDIFNVFYKWKATKSLCKTLITTKIKQAISVKNIRKTLDMIWYASTKNQQNLVSRWIKLDASHRIIWWQ